MTNPECTSHGADGGELTPEKWDLASCQCSYPRSIPGKVEDPLDELPADKVLLDHQIGGTEDAANHRLRPWREICHVLTSTAQGGQRP